MIPAGVTIRPCNPEDVERVLELWRVAGAAGSLPDTADVILTRLERDRDLFVLAEAGGRLIGTLIGGWDGWRGNMYRLAVHPDHRRMGIGRALVQEVERRLQARGARRITALVLGAEDGARAFWSAAGYGHDGSIQRYFRNL